MDNRQTDITGTGIREQKQHFPESSWQARVRDLEILQKALRIPMYLYEKEGLAASFGNQAGEYPPPFLYLEKVQNGSCSDTYLPTDFGGLFGRLPLAPDLNLLVGPVSRLDYTRDDFHRIFSEYHISAEKQEDLVLFLHSIPHYLPQDFGQVLAMLGHFLAPDQKIDTALSFQNQVSERILSDSVSKVYDRVSVDASNNSLEFEAVVTQIVENGLVDRLSGLHADFFSLRTGTLAQTPLRNDKNLQIALITLITRAAIRGGVEDQLALQLSDQYIQHIEQAQSRQDLAALSSDALLCFTTQVARSRREPVANADMKQIVDYIRRHTSDPLTVAGIASTFGYNPSYLSSRFKKELGFGLSSFIYRARLEEARQLLTYTNKSLLEISDYLRFTDQSHFQRRFKAQYGMTPLEYRSSRQR